MSWFPGEKYPWVQTVGQFLENAGVRPVNFAKQQFPILGVQVNNPYFALDHIPFTESLQVFINGIFQRMGTEYSYVLNGSTVVFNEPLDFRHNDMVEISYAYA